MAKQKDILQRSAEAPAEILDMSVVVTQRITEALPAKDIVQKTEDYWHMLGPGLTTGASDDDPSGIATYSQTGAQFGFHLLWLAAWTFPLSAVVQLTLGILHTMAALSESVHPAFDATPNPINPAFARMSELDRLGVRSRD